MKGDVDMRFLTYIQNGEALPGVIDPTSNEVVALNEMYPSILALLEACDGEYGAIREALEAGRLPRVGAIDDLELGPPVHFPRKMLCVAGNYVDHIKEGGGELQAHHTQAPWVFTVPPTTVLIGHRQPIRLHPQYRKTDYEGELAVVIGRRAKGVKADDAPNYIAGYTIYNDVSERAPFMIEHVEQRRELSFWYTKSFDTYGPLGPVLVTHDEIADPQNLTIRVLVNGEERQKAETHLMIFSVYDLVAFLSSFMTLEPGDVIATGTPSGVGYATGKFLEPNDQVQITIDGIGTLENTVITS